MPQSEFLSIPRDWDELRIPNLAQISLIKFYRILQNANLTDLSTLPYHLMIKADL